ncbi:MAG: hypothetical protein QNJ19_03660 [Woeseiaceae bacterium]|nr:hypothetical protein [Woeseiaceae bacterium]
MIAQHVLFVTAGAVGVAVSVIHGVLMQRLMIAPILAGGDLPDRSRRIFPALMHFSTVVWFLAGVALVFASVYLPASTTMVVACVTALLYALGAFGNFWGTRGRHFGWIPLAFSVALIAWALVV